MMKKHLQKIRAHNLESRWKVIFFTLFVPQIQVGEPSVLSLIAVSSALICRTLDIILYVGF